MFRHAAWYYAWLRPVPFTQKQLRLDIEALEKRYRELGYFGVRVTTDFSMQKSLDRVAKNVRLDDPRSTSARRSPSRSRATAACRPRRCATS